MTKNDIPPEVRRFILADLASVPHMEALVLLRATAPARWSAHSLARRLYVSTAAASTLMGDLLQAGMVARDEQAGAWFYECRSPALAGVADQLAVFYASHLIEITVLIHSAHASDFRKES